jgi:tryptophan synthase alpha chain
MSRFSATFARLRESAAVGLFPYVMAGFPDVRTSRELADAALDAGADGFEIGVPFSDPLADGTTMQRVNAQALEGGATLDTAFDLARHIRQRSAEAPIALMTYFNPVRQRGEVRFADDMASSEVDGVIVPDLPVDEAGELNGLLRQRGLSLLPLIAPTSPDARIRAAAALEPAFIYCVALVGVTGARSDLSANLTEFLGRVRSVCEVPLIVGFGISRPEHVRRVADLGASGAIVASALVDLIERSPEPASAARTYLAEMKSATHRIDALVR